MSEGYNPPSEQSYSPPHTEAGPNASPEREAIGTPQDYLRIKVNALKACLVNPDPRLKPLFETDLARCEAIQRGGDTEGLRNEIEGDLARAIEQYTSKDAANEASVTKWRKPGDYDYAMTDAEMIAARQRELHALTGESPEEAGQRRNLLAEIQWIREHPEWLAEGRKFYHEALQHRDWYRNAERKYIGDMQKVRVQLPARPASPSPNREGSQAENPEQQGVPLETEATQFNEQVKQKQDSRKGTVSFRLSDIYSLYRRLKHEGSSLPTLAVAQAQRTIEAMLKAANEEIPGLFGYTYEDTYNPQTIVGAYDNRRVEGRIEDAFRDLTEALTAYELSGREEAQKQAIVSSLDTLKSRLQAAGIVGNAQVPNITELESDTILKLYEERIVDQPHIITLAAAA